MNTQRFIKNIAAQYGWKIQPDKNFLQKVTEGLEQNFSDYGYYLCPCREGWNKLSKDRDIICPCKYAITDIREYGQCYCGLFLSKEMTKDVSSIPDRRPDHLYPD